jgi:hypothetical protein
MVGFVGVATFVCIAISYVVGGLVLERKYGTARHKPDCAVLRLITWSE